MGHSLHRDLTTCRSKPFPGIGQASLPFLLYELDSVRAHYCTYKGIRIWEPPPKERVGLFGEGCEILEEAPGFRRCSSFSQCFQDKVGDSLDSGLSPFPPLTEHSSPQLTCTPPINSFHLYVSKLPALYMWFLQARCGLLLP